MKFKKQSFTATPDLVGKYINRHLYSDSYPMGKIIGIKSKTKVLVQRVEAERDPNWKPEYIPGGFSAHCINQGSQTWVFTETPEVFEMRLSASSFRQPGRLSLDEKPYKYYDYNF